MNSKVKKIIYYLNHKNSIYFYFASIFLFPAFFGFFSFFRAGITNPILEIIFLFSELLFLLFFLFCFIMLCYKTLILSNVLKKDSRFNQNIITGNKNQKTIIKNYKGNYSKAMSLFQEDYINMENQNYIVESKNWIEGEYKTSDFIVAFILFIVVIGIFILFYMLLKKPDGNLQVTYKLKEDTKLLYKQCPKCAEDIKINALLCRYCNFSLE